MPSRTPSLSVSVLGPLLVLREGESVPLRPAGRRLLAILYLAPGREIDLGSLVDRMWVGDAPRTARASLHVHMSAIRSLSRDLVMSTSTGYRSGSIDDDRPRLTTLTEESDRATADHDWSRVLDTTARGLALWRGQPFAELADDAWANAEIRRLEELREHLVDGRLDGLVATGQFAGAVALAREEVGRDPLREGAWHRLTRVLLASNRPAEALRALEGARRTLADELGVEPSRWLTDLEQRIRVGDPAPDLWLHPTPTNLPRLITSFVGREDDLRAVESLLDDQRVVTVIGGPGVGKTRLAIEAGWGLLGRYPDGVWLASLASARTGQDVTSTIITASRTQRHIVGLADLASHLASRRSLLILDNCEHLIEPSTAFLEAVGALPGHLRVLATSRQAIVESDRSILTLAPLPLAHGAGRGPIASSSSPALRLFADRARAVDPGFRLVPETLPFVTEVCQRTAGIPLALELTASWLPAIGVADLRHVFEPHLGWHHDDAGEITPHASLAAAIERSTELLPSADQQLLTDLSVFAGTFGLSDAHLVCAPGEPLRAVAAGIARLVDASLLVVERRPAGRVAYRMMVPIREHQRQAGRAIGEPVHRAFVEHYLAKAQAWNADPFAFGTDYAGMDDDIDNVREAFSVALESGRADDVARGILSLTGYFYDRYLAWEARDWLERALEDVRDPLVRAPSLMNLGSLHQNTDDLVGARRLLAQGLRLSRANGDPTGAARCLLSIAQVHSDRGEWAACRRAADRALRLLGPDARPTARAVASYYLGEGLAYEGRVREGIPALLEAARLFRDTGQIHRSSYALSSLVMMAVLAGLEEPARRYGPLAVGLARSGGTDMRLARALAAAGTAEAVWGDSAKSRGMLVEASERLGPAELTAVSGFLLPAGFLLRRMARWDWLLTMLRGIDAIVARLESTPPHAWEEVVDHWRREAAAIGVTDEDRSDGVEALTAHELAARTRQVLTSSH